MTPKRCDVNSEIVSLYPLELRLARKALAAALADTRRAALAVRTARERVRRAEERMEAFHAGA